MLLLVEDRIWPSLRHCGALQWSKTKSNISITEDKCEEKYLSIRRISKDKTLAVIMVVSFLHEVAHMVVAFDTRLLPDNTLAQCQSSTIR